MDELKNSDWTWEYALDEYREDLKTSGRHSPDTIRVRMNLISRISKFAIKRGVTYPGDSNKTLLQEYFKTRKISNNSKTTQIRFLVHFFDFLESNYVVIDNCAKLLPTPKVKNKERIIPSTNEIKEIYNAIFQKKNQAVLLRDLVIFDLLTNPAIRVSELTKLRVQDVFFEERQIRITRKGGNEQLLPVKRETIDNIEEMLDLRESYTLSDNLLIAAKRYKGKYRGLSTRGAQSIVREYMLGCFKLNKHTYGPHLLRHFGGTAMCRNGVDLPTVQRILGHKNIHTTMIYQHPDEEQKRAAVDSGESFYPE